MDTAHTTDGGPLVLEPKSYQPARSRVCAFSDRHNPFRLPPTAYRAPRRSFCLERGSLAPEERAEAAPPQTTDRPGPGRLLLAGPPYARTTDGPSVERLVEPERSVGDTRFCWKLGQLRFPWSTPSAAPRVSLGCSRHTDRAEEIERHHVQPFTQRSTRWQNAPPDMPLHGSLPHLQHSRQHPGIALVPPKQERHLCLHPARHQLRARLLVSTREARVGLACGSPLNVIIASHEATMSRSTCGWSRPEPLLRSCVLAVFEASHHAVPMPCPQRASGSGKSLFPMVDTFLHVTGAPCVQRRAAG